MKKILFILTSILFSGTLLYAQAPVINSFSPVTGYVGSTVTITGANFDGTSPANNQVFFGSAQATVLTSSFGTLTVSVPAGSTTSLISVRNAATGLTGYSSNHFNGLFCNTPLTSTSYAPFSTATGDQEITGIYGAYNIDIYDIDGDGKSDIITGHNSNGLTIARNNSSTGTMNFVATNIATGAAVGQFFVADFDGDGKRDIVISGSNGAYLYRNLSTPGTISFGARITLTSTVGFYQCAAGDIDNDGKIDFVGGSGNNINTYRNTSTGPGNFSFTVNTIVAVGSASNGIQCVDVDGDGKADIVGTQRNANRIYALRNTSTTSTFSFAAQQTFSTVSTGPYRLKMADFDKDGKIDFVMPLYEGARTCVFRNTSTVGSINFSTPLLLTASAQNYRVGVGDVNGDGLPDVVTKPNGIGTIFQVFLNTSTGPGVMSFDPFIQYNSAAGSEVGGIAIGDMDGDLVPDIATSGISSNKIRFHRNKGAQIDATPPNANCKNIIVALSPSGTVSVTGAMIDNGSSDACGLKPFLINGQPSVTFNCNNIGPNTVTLTVTDLANNTTTCNAVVTVAPAAIIVSGQTTVCQGQTVTLTANLGDSYQWLKDGNVIAGANSQTFVATESGNYSVTVANAGGCSGTSTPTAITVNNNPTVAITPSGNASLCPPNGSVQISATTSSIYQWKKDGANIAGATQQTYTATTTGNYSVQVIDLFGCSATSSPVAINAIDNIPPVAKCKNISVVLNSNGTASITAADVNNGSTDNCGISSITISGQTSYSCSDVGQTIPVTLTVKDNNNESICTAQVTVTDPNMVCNTPPVVVCKPLVIPASAGCQGVTPANAFDNGSTDANGDALTFSVFPAGPYALGTTNVTLTVMDSKGATSTCNTTVTVEDKTPPVLMGTTPADITVSCSNIPAAPSVNASDDCDANPMVTLSTVSTRGSDPTQSSYYNYTITRTWTAKDISNNEAIIATQVVTVEDKTSPEITCPANVMVSCQNNKSSSATGVATAADDCSPVVITETETSTQNSDPSSAGHYNYTITRTWRATDVSGNFSECVQTITVQDVTAPAITVPANATVNCQDNTAPSALGSATGLDNCSLISISHTDVSTKHADANNAAHYNYTITRTWTVTDASGNATTGNQLIMVHDVTKPALMIPTTVTVNCQDDNTSGATGTATGSDNCSPVSITQYDASTQSPNPNSAGHYNYVISRTWTVTDVSGNATSATQTITVQDVTKPLITVPANATINCQASSAPAATGFATGTDNCGPVAVSYIDATTKNPDVSNAAHYNYTITRTWTVTDISGNATSADQLITVLDVTKPILVIPADASVNCQDDKSSNATGVATATDNCSPVNISHSDVTIQNADPNNAGHYNYTISRTWKATDVSGNTESTIQTITVRDVTKPIITVPASLTQNCQDNTAPSATGSATAPDNCSPVTITHSDVSTQNPNAANVAHYNYSIARTWTATDASGNTISGIQTITVQDVTKPVVKTKNVTVTLVNGVASIDVPTINDGSSDNCSPLTYLLSKSSFNCDNLGQNTVTLTATDVSGNTATATAIVTVVGVIPSPAITVSRTNTTFTGIGNERTIFIGYGAQSLTLGATNSTSTQANTQYSWSPASHLNTTSGITTAYTPNPGAVGHNTITVTATNEFGCSKKSEVVISVVDSRCGPDMKKVQVCHVSHSNLLHENTICIDASAVAVHLNAGCTINECASGAVAPGSVQASDAKTLNGLTVNVAPNPTSTHFRISVESNDRTKVVQLKVYDLKGRLIETRTNVAINTVVPIGANYRAGIYLVEVWQGSTRRQLKLVKLGE